jgi:hypothetical protein
VEQRRRWFAPSAALSLSPMLLLESTEIDGHNGAAG